MNLKRFQLFFIVAIFVSPLSAETITGTWSTEGLTATSATGTIDGLTVIASSTDTSPFIGVSNSRFTDTAGWQAAFPLSADVGGLTATNVNGGDSQAFQFSGTLESGMLYIENFDSLSSANITVAGIDPTVSLLAGSEGITFTPGAAGQGILTTSNANSDGLGDAILEFSGNVTAIDLDYTSGEGANGVFYAFAVDSVPEPSSGLLAGWAFTLLLAVRRRR